MLNRVIPVIQGYRVINGRGTRLSDVVEHAGFFGGCAQHDPANMSVGPTHICPVFRVVQGWNRVFRVVEKGCSGCRKRVVRGLSNGYVWGFWNRVVWGLWNRVVWSCGIWLFRVVEQGCLVIARIVE